MPIYSCGACGSLVTADMTVVEASADAAWCKGRHAVDFAFYARHASNDED